MGIHKLLLRQLERNNLCFQEVPNNLEKWQAFIERVNKTYLEADQERYLLERSMDISSREMMSINQQLERAQFLAELCYWNYNATSEVLTWSNEIYALFELNPVAVPPTFEEFIELVHPNYRTGLRQNIKTAMAEQIDFDYEIQVKVKDYKWFRLIIKPNDHEHLTGVILNINKAKEAEFKIDELHTALLTTARLAGMSEVATTILHNIGNLLNSTNVSVAIIKQNQAQARHQKLATLVAMILENRHQLDKFLLQDKKGKLILPYLEKMVEILDKEWQTNIDEISHLEKNLNHIKEIVAMQKSLSGIAGISEKISIQEVIRNALEMLSIKDIRLTKFIDEKIPFIFSEKAKLLQILTNLLRNAREAVLENTEKKVKEISIIAKPLNGEKIKIIIKDNGIGIPVSNLKRIFSFGFTTKIKGHGFGLHSAALSAKELGGVLLGRSEGEGLGAEFILILPIKTPDKKEK